MRVLGERGVKALSFRSVAKELGGSTTLVTHYFNTQAELIGSLADSLFDSWEGDLENVEVDHRDPRDRLRILLEWLVPLDEESLIEERARIGMLAERLFGAELNENFEFWETRARELIRSHLESIVPAEDLELRVDMVRAFTNGLTLSIVEHPELWPPDRVRTVIGQAMYDMKLDRRRRRD